MPLEPGASNDVVSSNISELGRGRVVGKTRRKYGKKRAHKQAVAISLAKAGRSNKKPARKRG